MKPWADSARRSDDCVFCTSNPWLSSKIIGRPSWQIRIWRSPEADVMRRQVAKLLERAIAKLPETFRPVFVLRDVEELSVEETAEALQIPKETVKTRLLRARRRLQEELDPELRGALQDTFPFLGEDCDALTERVLARFLAAGS